MSLSYTPVQAGSVWAADRTHTQHEIDKARINEVGLNSRRIYRYVQVFALAGNERSTVGGQKKRTPIPTLRVFPNFFSCHPLTPTFQMAVTPTKIREKPKGKYSTPRRRNRIIRRYAACQTAKGVAF